VNRAGLDMLRKQVADFEAEHIISDIRTGRVAVTAQTLRELVFLLVTQAWEWGHDSAVESARALGKEVLS
jgi:hypothetical protein